MHRRSRLRLGVATLVAAVALVAGCSDDEEPNPAQERLDRVEARLSESFSAAQTECILDQVEPATLRELDRKRDLEPGSEELADYSDAVATCVSDPGAATTTTKAAAETSEAPSTTATGG